MTKKEQIEATRLAMVEGLTTWARRAAIHGTVYYVDERRGKPGIVHYFQILTIYSDLEGETSLRRAWPFQMSGPLVTFDSAILDSAARSLGFDPVRRAWKTQGGGMDPVVDLLHGIERVTGVAGLHRVHRECLNRYEAPRR